MENFVINQHNQVPQLCPCVLWANTCFCRLGQEPLPRALAALLEPEHDPQLAACFDWHCVMSMFDSFIRILEWLKSLLPKPWIWSLSVMKPITPEREPRGTAGTAEIFFFKLAIFNTLFFSASCISNFQRKNYFLVHFTSILGLSYQMKPTTSKYGYWILCKYLWGSPESNKFIWRGIILNVTVNRSAAPHNSAECDQQCATQFQHFIIYCQTYSLLLAALIGKNMMNC